MAKRGRKRRVGVKREPNGRASRASGQIGNPTDVVLNARMRHFGFAPEVARGDKAGFPLGRLRLWGKVSESEYEAGLEFERVLRAYIPILRSIPPEARAGLKVRPMAELLASIRPDHVKNAEERAKQFMVELGNLDSVAYSRGRTATAIVWAVCISYEDHLGLGELEKLKKGLRKIDEVWQCSRRAA